jgi:hypothetical protein
MKKSPVELNQANNQAKNEIAKDTAFRLLAFCRANDWAGHDPYDALNSRVFRAMPFLNFKIARLILTQAVKRFPINLRPLLLVTKTPNPKGIALFLSSIVRLSKIGVAKDSQEVRALADTLLALRSPGQRYSCWGYNFDWQTRNELVPSGSPNIICSTFAANALLDAHGGAQDSPWLEAAISTAEFILDILYWRLGSSVACFSYTPLERSEIHNANLLGAAFLCRIGREAGQRRFFEPALDAARYSVSKQHADGSWSYGEAPHQEWIDNFHTGFNLVALKRIGEYAETVEFDAAVRRGFDFYRAHFFREDGAPRYYHDATYPLDIHSVAQSIITLVEFEELSKGSLHLARLVLNWATANMWDPSGFFYFQQRRYFTVRIPFMRWSQAWMLLALSTFLTSSRDEVVSS